MTILGERSDVPEQLRSAAVAVHACGYDACSLAVLEAMAAGRPVVASRIGGMDEIVAEGVTGELARHDPEEWAETVGALLDDPVAAEAMGRAGRERATGRYARDRMAAEVLDLYRTVAAQPSGRMGR
jgi:glycosyltransferase involved in cell wall biosynthesis